MGLFSSIGSVAGMIFGGPMGGAIGGSIGGVIDGSKAKKSAERSSEEERAMLKEQARLYSLQSKMGEHFFDEYRNKYQPLADEQLQASKVGLDPRYYEDFADSAVVSNQARALDMTQRNMARNGVNSGDGRWLAMQGQQALNLAGTRVGARNRARQQVNNTNWDRRQQAVNYGSGLVNRGSNMMSTASNGFGNLAGVHGGNAQKAGSAAGYSFGSVAKDLVGSYRQGALGGRGGFGGFGGTQGINGGLSGGFGGGFGASVSSGFGMLGNL